MADPLLRYSLACARLSPTFPNQLLALCHPPLGSCPLQQSTPARLLQCKACHPIGPAPEGQPCTCSACKQPLYAWPGNEQLLTPATRVAGVHQLRGGAPTGCNERFAFGLPAGALRLELSNKTVDTVDCALAAVRLHVLSQYRLHHGMAGCLTGRLSKPRARCHMHAACAAVLCGSSTAAA